LHLYGTYHYTCMVHIDAPVLYVSVHSMEHVTAPKGYVSVHSLVHNTTLAWYISLHLYGTYQHLYCAIPGDKAFREKSKAYPNRTQGLSKVLRFNLDTGKPALGPSCDRMLDYQTGFCVTNKFFNAFLLRLLACTPSCAHSHSHTVPCKPVCSCLCFNNLKNRVVLR
jgi:hypothetical protein